MKDNLTSSKSCRICNHEANYIFQSIVLNNYKVTYYHCSNCSFLFTEKPYWLEEAYKEPINKSDTGILQRNIDLANFTTKLLFYLFDHNKTFLDFGGGYGFFVRLMRDKGFDFLWDDAYTENLLARGFEYGHEPIELITSFETFEHFEDPIYEIEKMLTISSNILFTTVLYPNPIPRPENWWYYGLQHGQHISFYNLDTLNFIAYKYNLNIYSNGFDFHLLTSRKVNKYLWRILNSSRFSFYLNKYIKRKLVSKTWTDHFKIKAN